MGAHGCEHAHELAIERARRKWFLAGYRAALQDPDRAPGAQRGDAIETRALEALRRQPGGERLAA